MYDVSYKTIDDMTLAALEHRGEYSQSTKAFQKLATMLSTGGHWPDTRGMAGVFYDDPDTTQTKDLRSHAGAIWGGAELPEGLEKVTLKGGRYAVLHLKGPYSDLAAAYGYLYGPWLAQSQVELRDDPSFEIYLNDVTQTAPADLLTDIYMPLVA